LRVRLKNFVRPRSSASSKHFLTSIWPEPALAIAGLHGQGAHLGQVLPAHVQGRSSPRPCRRFSNHVEVAHVYSYSSLRARGSMSPASAIWFTI
jgi:hypothetical protein